MSNASSGKSPYQRGNSSQRSRGWMLIVTVVILLVGLGAWMMTYTRAVELQRPTNEQGIDPGPMSTDTTRTVPGTHSGNSTSGTTTK
jgi:hypothetical protein